MIRIAMMWLCVGIYLTVDAQIVTITDLSTGEPLEWVAVSGSNSGKNVLSDAYGKADLASFEKSDTIGFHLIGYQDEHMTYTNLAANNFKVSLTRLPVALDEMVVSAYNDEEQRQESFHIEPLPLKEIEKQGSFNLTDALSRVPGISSLSTGIGIPKPVIRGLYGNRILVLFSGLRFDNQQWQDEHGLGLSDIGISRVEIIKGPLSLLYGTEAMGGVINILEEEKPQKGTSSTDAGVEIHSNTAGGTIQAGTKANYGKRWYRVRVAANNHADYSDGNGDRVLNSRFNGLYLKSTYGFKRKNWKSVNHYNFSYNKYGFVFSDISKFFEPDARWSSKMSGPHHNVMLNIFSSLNEIRLKNSLLKLNAGIQSNQRSEDEGGGELSLNMHLLTGQYALKWNKKLGKHTLLVIANNSSVENNTNYGRRKIVPDAWMAESALSGYLRHEFKKLAMEYGIGGGVRHIHTLLTSRVNSPEKDIAPFSQVRPFYNGMLGFSYNPTERLNIKTNIATGVRAPNLAELSSNGLHEGIYTYEIGDPNMTNEQNINTDVGIYYTGKTIQLSVSGFYNHFNGYIYLDPTTEDWFGFPVYRFRQQNARIYGGEAVAGFTPSFVKGLKVTAAYSGLIGELADGDYLPFMPAQKLKPEVRYEKDFSDKCAAYGYVNADIVMFQGLVNSAEMTTPAYNLLNAGAGITVKGEKANYKVFLAMNNLLNEAYFDHLSRYKFYGLLNIGRDISLNLKINFVNRLKQHKNENKN